MANFYKSIQGYEDSYELAIEIEEEILGLIHNLSYGEAYSSILSRVKLIKGLIEQIETHISDGEGKKK